MKIINLSLALIVAAVLQVQAQDPLTNGLVAYYPFKGSANDASGKGNNGSLVQTDWQFRSDRFGNNTNSLFLNATSIPAWYLPGAYVSAPRPVDFNGNFSITVWVNFTNLTALPNPPGDGFAHNLISNGGDSATVNLRVNTDRAAGNDAVQFTWGGPNSSVIVPVPLVRRTWWQISVVRLGSVLTIYRNGIVLTNGFVLPTVNTASIWLGRHQDSNPYPFVGGMDDLRIYNRALSGAEVQELYQVESGPHTDIARAVRLTHTHLQIGGNYQLQSSLDLTNWTNSGSPFTSASSTNSQYVDVTNYNTFWRLKVAP